MNIFDLLFIALVLTSVVVFIGALIALIKGRRKRAVSLLRRLAVGAAVYLAIVAVISAATPAKVLKVGDVQCNDDWCIAVDDVRWSRKGPTRTCDVTLRLSNRGRGRAQREHGVGVYLIDADRRRYDPNPVTSALPFDTLIQAGESVTTERQFELPQEVRDVGLVVDHGGGFPGCLIISENTWFHKPTVVRLAQPVK